MNKSSSQILAATTGVTAVMAAFSSMLFGGTQSLHDALQNSTGFEDPPALLSFEGVPMLTTPTSLRSTTSDAEAETLRTTTPRAGPETDSTPESSRFDRVRDTSTSTSSSASTTETVGTVATSATPSTSVVAPQTPSTTTSTISVSRTAPAASCPALLMDLDSEVALSNQALGQLQTAGQIFQAGTVGDDGISTHGRQQFGRVNDPLSTHGSVIRYSANQNDLATVGGIRTETVHHPLPYNESFWQATRIMWDDWSDSSDNQIVFQWHDGDHSGYGPPAPILAFYVIGDSLQISLAYDASDNPGRSTMSRVTLFREDSSAFAGRWQDLVIHSRISPFEGDEPFLDIWRDGEKIVEYRGPIAFNQPEVQDYAKLGIYHWTNSGNVWDQRYPTRNVYVDRMVMSTEDSTLGAVGQCLN